MSGLKSSISLTCRSVMPPDTGTTVSAQPLGAVVEAEPAGEQPVAVGILHQHAGPAAGGAHAARDDVGPGLDVAPAVADHRRLSGRAGRGVDAQQLLARHRHHPERIILAQLALGRERKFAQVVERLQVVGMHAGGVESLLVVRDVFVDMRQRPFQALELQRRNLVARGDLDRIEGFAARRQVRAFRNNPGIPVPPDASFAHDLIQNRFPLFGSCAKSFAAPRSSVFPDWRSAPG